MENILNIFVGIERNANGQIARGDTNELMMMALERERQGYVVLQDPAVLEDILPRTNPSTVRVEGGLARICVAKVARIASNHPSVKRVEIPLSQIRMSPIDYGDGFPILDLRREEVMNGIKRRKANLEKIKFCE